MSHVVVKEVAPCSGTTRSIASRLISLERQNLVVASTNTITVYSIIESVGAVMVNCFRVHQVVYKDRKF